MTKKYIITGLVQGIGFRPAVKRIADSLGVCGTVKNSGGVVEVIAHGSCQEEFLNRLFSIPNSVIDRIITEEAEDIVYEGFVIVKSGDNDDIVPVIPADIAVCKTCLSQFDDIHDRRYRHPFISCTACGPRYSIIDELPYDRENTVMSDFDMCDKCKYEYRDIGDRRCHAQTIACMDCGPILKYTKNGDPLDCAVNDLNNGEIVAIKDIGGYHFACSAQNEVTVKRLRELKGRDKKPFAVMFHDLDEVRKYADPCEIEESLLVSAQRPIVLLKKIKDLAGAVCGNSDQIGAFLPCDPIQHELTKKCGILVMTSANISGEPIITKDDEMFRLRDSQGGFEILSHDRRILTPLDDSVCRVTCGRVQMIRRARGYTPLPILISTDSSAPVLAAGGDLKASFCYAYKGRAYMSQYFGDLENMKAYELWKSNINRMGSLLNIKEPGLISDLHPGYFSSGYIGGEKLQHHFAHMASVMAEHRLDETALGFVFDGTGYGEDGCVWGGEVIRYSDGCFTRIAGLEYTELLGGDGSAKDASLTLDCYLIAAGIAPIGNDKELIKAALSNHINTIRSSSMGRLFDAVSALLKISAYNTYEGESAIMLEQTAAAAKRSYSLKLKMKENKWCVSELIRDVTDAYKKGVEVDNIALGFHHAISDAIAEVVSGHDEKKIILSGGVFSNRLLTEQCIDKLKGYDVYINEKVPTNDGGIALGQAWYALNRKS